MAFTAQYIICNTSIVKCMHSLFESFKIKFRSLKMEYKMDLFAKIVQGYGPSTILVKNSILDVLLSLNTTLQKASHY